MGKSKMDGNKKICISEDSVSTGAVIKDLSKASIKDKIAAEVILKETISKLSEAVENIEKSLTSVPISAIQKELKDQGLIESEDETPVFVIKTKFGEYRRYIAEESKFEADRKILGKLLDDGTLDSSMFRTETVRKLLDTKEYKKLFEEGQIPSIYKSYFGTKLSSSIKAVGRDKIGA